MKRRSNLLEKEYKQYLMRKEHIGFEYDKPVMNFKHWIIIPNKFPYDLIAKKHHLLIPKIRKPGFRDLPLETQREYDKILGVLGNLKVYKYYQVNFPGERSVPHHWHCHLLG